VLLTWLVRTRALAHGRLDLPNARSSHTQPTPRGGGLGIAAVLVAVVLVLWVQGALAASAALAYGVGGALVAVIGALDDRFNLPALPRFGTHVVAAALAVALLLRAPDAIALWPIVPRAVVLAILVLAIVWSVNLFNFMDGIDGIAASQAVFVSAASALLTAQGELAADAALLTSTASACLGFLAWNWPPAKIFMGDVGSGFLGFWLAVLAIGLHVAGELDIWTSVILSSTFVADATVTLLRRMARGERWYEAHRSHAYQHLALRWRSHLKVTCLTWGVNLLVVLPIAWTSTVWRDSAPWLAIGLLSALCFACFLTGAGTDQAKTA
jgi:Fuc2NAc and GlcNAc transferase